jgi:hypothetical protein
MHSAACFLAGGNWGSFVVTCQGGRGGGGRGRGVGVGGGGRGEGGGKLFQAILPGSFQGHLPYPLALQTTSRNMHCTLSAKAVLGLDQSVFE